MEARALGRLLDEKNHSLCLSCRSTQLFYLIFWTVYLLFLRALNIFPRCINLSPKWFQAHIIKTESRIANIVISIIQILSGRDLSYSSFSKNTYMYRLEPRQRDMSYEGSMLSTGPADNLVAPADSSLESNYTPPEMFIHPPNMAYLRPEAPRPPYRRENFENSRRASSLRCPLPSAIHANRLGHRRNNNHAFSQSLDGTISPLSLAEPIPQIPVPPIPAFISRMPFVSVSDSIYSSSCSMQLPVSEREASSEARTYIDLLPKRSFEDSDKSRQVNLSNENGVRNTSLGDASSVPARIQSDLQSNTLAAVAQRYARLNYRRSRHARSSSAPVVNQNNTEKRKP